MKKHINVRHDIRPGDTEAVIRLHQVLYGNEFGFDDSFLDDVSEPLQQFAASPASRNRLWLAEQDGEIVGCIAVVEHSPMVAKAERFPIELSCSIHPWMKAYVASSITRTSP